MMTQRLLVSAIGSFSLLGFAAACASSPPPRELLDARAAFARAQTSPAEQLAPATLHDAKVALDRAEHSYSDDSDSEATRDLSYIAERKMDLAEVQAETSQAKQNAERATAQASARQAQAAGQLEQTREALDKERQARAEAEQHAHEALDKLAVVVANVAVKNDTRGTVITIPGSVLFGSGKADFLPTAQTSLDKIADALKDQADSQISVEGHTDAQGSETKNLELSQQRAEHVRDYLVSHGVPQDRIKAEGFGASRPIADNKTSEGRASNRRVELVVQPTGAGER